MVGKWHLDPNHACLNWIQANLPAAPVRPKAKVRIPPALALKYAPGNRGFTDYFCGHVHSYRANYTLDGKDMKPGTVQDRRFRLDIQSDAAVAFIDRNKEKPFFLYLAYFAPHVPLEASEKYLRRFPGEMPERRRYCLAMMSAIDDGVGRILERLQRHGLDEKTLVFFISDNGAPLKIEKKDLPISFKGGAWDGSLNDPWVGEKGMLTEGGIRVPFLVRWKGRLPAGRVYDRPIISLDVAATAAALAGADAGGLDGVNLIPYLAGERDGDPHEALTWRFWSHAAIRAGKWKYLRLADQREFLFDVAGDAHETKDLLKDHPDVARDLAAKLKRWCDGLKVPGMPTGKLNNAEVKWFGHYLGVKEE
jgi:arylsulfatase A-like enzyme